MHHAPTVQARWAYRQSKSSNAPRRQRRARQRTRSTFTFAYRHVRSGLGRMALTLLALALGVSLVVAFQLMNAAVLQSFLDTIDAMAGRAQLMVSAGEGLSFSEDLLDKVKSVPGVKLAVPLVRATTFPDDGSGEMLTVQGVDLANESAIRVYHDADKPAGSPNGVIDDMVEFLNSPDSIILGKEFADKRGLKKGDKLPLITPNGVQAFTIKGLLEAQGLAQTLRGRLVVMDLFAAERAFTADRQINQIDVLVDASHSPDAVRLGLEKSLPAGLQIAAPALRKMVLQKVIAGFQTMLTAFSLLAIIAGFVICFGRLSTIFEARIWEIGVMRALGMTSREVTFELVKESLLIGTIGTVAGLALGNLVGRLALPFFAATTAIAFRMPIPAAQSTTSIGAYGLGALVGLGAALGAAVLPALRLARTPPVTALRLRGRELALPAQAALRRGIQLVILALILAAFVVQTYSEVPALGLLITVLVALLVASLATPVVLHANALLGQLWSYLFGPTGELATKQLAQHTRRSALTVMTLALGLGLVLLLGILEWSFERTVVSNFTHHVTADLVVSSVPSGGQWEPLKEDIVASIASAEYVAGTAGEQIREMQDAKGSFRVASYDPTSFTNPRLFDWRLESSASPRSLELVASGQGVFATSAYARLRSIRAGDDIEVPSPTGPVKLKVLALSEAPMEPALVMSRSLYQQRWNDAAVTFVFVSLASPESIAAAEASLARSLGTQYRVQVQRRADYVDYFVALVREGFAIQNLLAITVFALVSVALSDAFASSVIERTRSFGMLRAVGLSRREMFRAVLLETSAIATLGLALAVSFGLIEGIFWVGVQFPALAGWTFEFHFPWLYAINVILITFGLCLLGGALPAYRAATMTITKALRTE